MELSIFVAKIIAVTYIAISIGQFFGGITYKKMYQDIMRSPAFMVMMGLFGIVIGSLLIEYHNIWVKDWTVIITIIRTIPGKHIQASMNLCMIRSILPPK